MDPEDLPEIITAFRKWVAETVRRFGGFASEVHGRRVLVYFGFPKHDAERAVPLDSSSRPSRGGVGWREREPGTKWTGRHGQVPR